MTMSHRRTREDVIRRLVHESSLHHVLHALVEICYEQGRRCENDYPSQVDKWRSVCQAVTAAEDRARYLGV